MNHPIIPTDYKNLLDHYINFWGEPQSTFDYSMDDLTPNGRIFVAEFNSKEYYNTWVYATVGLSWFPMKSAKWDSNQPDPRRELIIYVEKKNKQLATLLFSLARYPFDNKTFLGFGHTIPGTSEGIIDGSPLTDIIFAPPLKEGKELYMFHMDNNHHSIVLWVIPIYDSERRFSKKHGWKTLLEKFIEENMDPLDLYRPPVV